MLAARGSTLAGIVLHDDGVDVDLGGDVGEDRHWHLFTGLEWSSGKSEIA